VVYSAGSALASAGTTPPAASTCWMRLPNMARGVAPGAASSGSDDAIHGAWPVMTQLSFKRVVSAAMQRKTTDNKVIIACDFIGVDWDEQIPMIEGHRGSVISLEALTLAIEQAVPAIESAECTMCLRSLEPPEKLWRHPDPPANANTDAVICWDCIQQADRSFAQDSDIDWQRRIASTSRWR